jgi:hypothetical protein
MQDTLLPHVARDWAGVLEPRQQLIAELAATFTTTVVSVSHDLAVIRTIRRRAVVMRAGRICEDGPTDELFMAPRHPYTRELIPAIPSLPAALPRERSSRLERLGRLPANCHFLQKHRGSAARALDFVPGFAPSRRPAPRRPVPHRPGPRPGQGLVHVQLHQQRAERLRRGQLLACGSRRGT